MYLKNQHELPAPSAQGEGDGQAKTRNTPWRLHFEYTLESKEEADAHAAVCRERQLRVYTDKGGKTVRRRRTIAVLGASNEKHHEVTRFTGAAACSWTDTFSKEVGRRTALERLEKRLKAGAEGRLTAEQGKRLAQAARHVYNQRAHYKPLREALDLLKRVDTEAAKGQVGHVTQSSISIFLRQFN